MLALRVALSFGPSASLASCAITRPHSIPATQISVSVAIEELRQLQKRVLRTYWREASVGRSIRAAKPICFGIIPCVIVSTRRH